MWGWVFPHFHVNNGQHSFWEASLVIHFLSDCGGGYCHQSLSGADPSTEADLSHCILGESSVLCLYLMSEMQGYRLFRGHDVMESVLTVQTSVGQPQLLSATSESGIPPFTSVLLIYQIFSYSNTTARGGMDQRTKCIERKMIFKRSYLNLVPNGKPRTTPRDRKPVKFKKKLWRDFWWSIV